MNAAKPSRPFSIRDGLYQDLRSPVIAATYLNEALLEGDDVVLKTAMADVIRANGVTQVARQAGLHRVTVYKTLKAETDSSFSTMRMLLQACGVRLQAVPREAAD